MDYFHVVGGLGLGSRLKRLSDSYFNEVRRIYQAEGLDFDPKWFPLFSLLVQRSEVTVTEAAELLSLTHPHISQLTKELVAAKLLTLRKNATDGRSRHLTLTNKGRGMAESLKPLWQDIQDSVAEVITEVDSKFLSYLEKMEHSLKHKPLSLRTQEKIKNRFQYQCQIIDYTPALKSDFERLNREWLEKYFSVEEVDREYFASPEKMILKKGGDIFFAQIDGEMIGTCSLLKEKGQLELAKMAVAEKVRGKGIGEILAREALRRAKKMGAKKVFLVTNSKLIPAIRLYEKLGFKEVFRGQHPKYARGDLIMELFLKDIIL